MLQRYYTHWELHNMIAAIVKNAGSKGITRTQICRALGRSKAPHIIEAIEDCVHRDLIVKIDLVRGSQPYFLYFTKENVPDGQPGAEAEVDRT